MEKEKKKYIFLISIVIIGLITGIVFANILSDSDFSLVSNKLTDYFNNIKNNNEISYLTNLVNSLKNNLTYMLVIWLLGLGVIGLVINPFLLYFKSFVIGFSIGSIINIYLYEGIIGSILYIFPHHILNIFIYTVLSYFSCNFSLKIIKSIFFKKHTLLNELLYKYLKILLYSTILLLISSLIEVYLSPFIIKLFTFLIN